MYKSNGGARKVMEAFLNGEPLKIGNYNSTGRVLIMYETPILTWTTGLLIIKYESKLTTLFMQEFSSISGLPTCAHLNNYTYYLNGRPWQDETYIACEPPIEPVFYLLDSHNFSIAESVIRKLSHAEHLLYCMLGELPPYTPCVRKIGDNYYDATEYFAEVDSVFNLV